MKAADFQEPDGFQWVLFTDRPKAFLVHGDSITKAVASWRKDKSRSARAGEPVGIIRCGWSEDIPGAMRHTDVFGVVCCVHKPEGTP
jgi:hypothetical protein